MRVYVCKWGFITLLDVMLGTPLANERSTKRDNLDSGYEFVTVCSATLRTSIIRISIKMGVYVVNKGDWSKEIERDIIAKDP